VATRIRKTCVSYARASVEKKIANGSSASSAAAANPTGTPPTRLPKRKISGMAAVPRTSDGSRIRIVSSPGSWTESQAR
jgi:hypothetical protein